VILLANLLDWTQPFRYIELNYFAMVNSTIFNIVSIHFMFFQSFCYVELNHFSTVNSTICYSELSHFYYSPQSFCDSISHFCYGEFNHFATVNSTILQFCQSFAMMNSTIFCYSELNHFVTVLSYFVILSDILLQWLTHSLLWPQLFCYS
jgi:hypothetical protein